MTPFNRGDAPAILTAVAESATASYVERRNVDPAAEFRWPQRDGTSILPQVREALASLTQDHCSYCDGFPIDATGRKEVDHFRPKRDFPREAFAWPNLYLVCSACNAAKLAEWNALLIRPDEPEYLFERFFVVNALSGELMANPGATDAEQARALETIRIFGLQRGGLCTERRKAITSLRSAGDASNAYRFLSP